MNKPTLWHPMTQHGMGVPEIHIDRAEGAYLYTKDGRSILDGISSWWVSTHGHCHPKVVEAVQAQAPKLEQVIFAGFTHDAAEELAEKLLHFVHSSLGDAHQHIFLSDSGSTAIEVALKMAIGYWEHRGETRRKILALEGGYHGDTFGAMSAGARGVFNAVYEPYLFEVEHLPFPCQSLNPCAAQDQNASCDCKENTLHILEKTLQQNKGNVAAFIFEPLVQGAAGFQMYPPETLRAMHELCKAHGVLMIADEVMTGFGRTGTKFACEQAGFAPDLLCLSKGLTGGFLPMGATLCTRKIYDAFYHEERSKMFFHSTSFTGNPLACVAASAALDIWEDEPVRDRIDFIASEQKAAAARFSAREDVTAVRQMGTLLALDVKAERDGYLSQLGTRLYDLFLAQDILLRPIGNCVYILPPYCVTKEDLEKIYDSITIALDRLGHEQEQYAA